MNPTLEQFAWRFNPADSTLVADITAILLDEEPPYECGVIPDADQCERELKTTSKRRKCLRCDGEFISEGGDRLCVRCQQRNRQMLGS